MTTLKCSGPSYCLQTFPHPLIVIRPQTIYKMTIIFTQNGQKLSFWVKIVVILKICFAVATVILFWGWDKSRDQRANSQILEHI